MRQKTINISLRVGLLVLSLLISKQAESQCIPLEYQQINQSDSTLVQELESWLISYDTDDPTAQTCLDSITNFLKGKSLIKAEGIVNYQLGWVYYAKDEYDKAIRYFLLGQDQSEASDFIRLQVACIAEVASIYHEIGQSEEAITQQHKAIELALKHPDKYQKIWALYHNMGMFYDGNGDHQNALSMYLKAKEHSKDVDDYDFQVQLDQNIGVLYDDLDNDEKHKAYTYLDDEALNKIQSPLAQVTAYNNNAYLAIKQGDYLLAKKRAHQTLQLAIEIQNQGTIETAYINLENSHLHLGEIDSAYHYLTRRFEEFNASIEAEAIRATTQVEADYQFEKEKAVTELENQAKLQRQRYISYSILGGLLFMALLAYAMFKNYRDKQRSLSIITEEKQKSDELLLNILPASMASELKQYGKVKSRFHPQASILFSDFEGFTQVSKQLSPTDLVNELDTIFRAFDKIIQETGIEKIKTIGDAYMCAAGTTKDGSTCEVNAIKCVETGLKMQEFIKNYESPHGISWKMRVGIHSGDVTSGVVGVKKFAYDIWGDSVNIASRMESSGIVGKVNISAATNALAKEKYQNAYRGKIEIKNGEAMEMFLVE